MNNSTSHNESSVNWWSCSRCHIGNGAARATCENCGTPRPGEVRDGASVQSALDALRSSQGLLSVNLTSGQAAALVARLEELEPAAECWAALSACARIKIMGCAGLHPDSPHNTPTYAHIGLEFWTEHEAKGDAQDLNGRDWFCRFMVKALAAYRAQVKA